MSQQSIKNLQRLKGELFKKFGVLKIGYFESYIDYHHNKLCDVNILVELEEPAEGFGSRGNGWRV